MGEEFEITIMPDGDVKLKTRGVKGKSCLEYARLFAKAVGRIQSQEITPEYYEPEAEVEGETHLGIDLKL